MVSQSELVGPERGRAPLAIGLTRFLVLVLLAALAIWVPTERFIRHGLAGDVWWAWKAGQWMALHHAILLHDPSSWNGPGMAGKPWVNLEWGWEWLLYVLVPKLSAAHFLAVLLALELALMAAFYWAIRTVAPRLAPELQVLSYFVYQVIFLDLKLRAEIVSYVFFPLLLTLLWKGRKHPRWLWPIPLLAAVWANIHGSWLLIVVFGGLEVLWALYQHEGRSARAMALWSIALPLALAVLLTPNHLATLTYTVWLDRNHDITTYIQEWQSANFHLPAMAVLGLAVFAAWIWRAHRRVSSPLILDVWFAGAAFMCFDEVRMLSYFGVIFLLWIAYGLNQYPACQDRWPLAFRGRAQYPLVWVLGGIAAASFALPRVNSHRFLASAVPSSVVGWLTRHPHSGVFAPYGDGGYLIAHNVRDVYIDGRADLFLYNGHRFQSYLRIISPNACYPDQVARIFQEAHVNRVAWPDRQLGANLALFFQERHWHAAYTSGGWTIYAP
jgi:hypothetical protein